jgi:hypothetical protein
VSPGMRKELKGKQLKCVKRLRRIWKFENLKIEVVMSIRILDIPVTKKLKFENFQIFKFPNFQIA